MTGRRVSKNWFGFIPTCPVCGEVLNLDLDFPLFDHYRAAHPRRFKTGTLPLQPDTENQ